MPEEDKSVEGLEDTLKSSTGWTKKKCIVVSIGLMALSWAAMPIVAGILYKWKNKRKDKDPS